MLRPRCWSGRKSTCSPLLEGPLQRGLRRCDDVQIVPPWRPVNALIVGGGVHVRDRDRRRRRRPASVSTSQASSTWPIAAMSAIEQPAARSGRTTCWCVARSGCRRDSAMKCTPQKTMYSRLGPRGGLARELERVAGDVGELDDLVALVVVAEHEHLVARAPPWPRRARADQVGVGRGRQVAGALDAALAERVGCPGRSRRSGGRGSVDGSVMAPALAIPSRLAARVHRHGTLCGACSVARRPGQVRRHPDRRRGGRGDRRRAGPRRAPDDELVLAPLSDGGPGFVDVLHAALGGRAAGGRPSPGRYGEPRPGRDRSRVGRHGVRRDRAGRAGCTSSPRSTATPTGRRRAASASCSPRPSTRAPRRVVVGLGGTATNDGGAGLLAALGASGRGRVAGRAARPGSRSSTASTWPRPATASRASSSSSPPTSTTRCSGSRGDQRASARRRALTDGAAVERRRARCSTWLSARGGREAGGDAGCRRRRAVWASPCCCSAAPAVPGVDTVARGGRPAGRRCADADLVVTGEGSFDWQSLLGKVVDGRGGGGRVGRAVPCVVLAGRVEVGSREMRAHGVESAYSVVDLVGEERALGRSGGEALADARRRGVARHAGRADAGSRGAVAECGRVPRNRYHMGLRMHRLDVLIRVDPRRQHRRTR